MTSPAYDCEHWSEHGYCIKGQDCWCPPLRDEQIVESFRKMARPLGYAVAVHGSRGPKDLDLIAVPWTEEAVGTLGLVRGICEASWWRPHPWLPSGEYPTEETRADAPVTYVPPAGKPHGRWAWAFVPWIEHGAPLGFWRVVDLSVVRIEEGTDG